MQRAIDLPSTLERTLTHTQTNSLARPLGQCTEKKAGTATAIPDLAPVKLLPAGFRSNDRLRLAGPVHLRRTRHKKDEALAKARQAACGKACGGAKAQLRQARTDLECASVVEVPSTDHCLCELMIRGMVPKRAVTIP